MCSGHRPVPRGCSWLWRIPGRGAIVSYKQALQEPSFGGGGSIPSGPVELFAQTFTEDLGAFTIDNRNMPAIFECEAHFLAVEGCQAHVAAAHERPAVVARVCGNGNTEMGQSHPNLSTAEPFISVWLMRQFPYAAEGDLPGTVPVRRWGAGPHCPGMPRCRNSTRCCRRS